MRCRTPKTAPSRAFTIVEVVVVIGVLMMLAALVMPAARNSIDAAKRSADMAVMRQNAALISVYVNDQRGVYPVGFDTAFRASVRWAQTLRAAGTIERLRESDPSLSVEDADEWTHHTLTLAAVFPWDAMRLGNCRDPHRSPPAAVRAADVSHPDSKGLLYNHKITYGPQSDNWCCLPESRPVGPVVFCDGSAELGRWSNYLPYPDRPIEFGIGVPIWSTWDGARGIDRSRSGSSP